jgi:hypothetical protein
LGRLPLIALCAPAAKCSASATKAESSPAQVLLSYELVALSPKSAEEKTSCDQNDGEGSSLGCFAAAKLLTAGEKPGEPEEKK